MRVLFAAAAMALCACSDEPESRPPVASLKPGGSGWECFRDRYANISSCERPGNCATSRIAYVAEAERVGASYDLSECVFRRVAVCFTAYIYVRGRAGYICAESVTDCHRMREAASKSAEYTEISDCGSW